MIGRSLNGIVALDLFQAMVYGMQCNSFIIVCIYKVQGFAENGKDKYKTTNAITSINNGLDPSASCVVTLVRIDEALTYRLCLYEYVVGLINAH